MRARARAGTAVLPVSPSESSLERLWCGTAPSGERFAPEQVRRLPEAAQRYLCRAIAPGATLANAVRLAMTGEIKLKGWVAFDAEQVIHRDRGFVWSARTRIRGLPVRGFDRLLDGRGEMRWRLLGIVPVMSAADDDVTRSAAGRWWGESFWLPSMLLSAGVAWKERRDPDAVFDPAADGVRDGVIPEAAASARVAAARTVLGEEECVELALSDAGEPTSVQLQRWGNPDGGPHRRIPFGGQLSDSRTFDGYTIPTRLHGGWFFGTDRFATQGEFVRIRVLSAAYR